MTSIEWLIDQLEIKFEMKVYTKKPSIIKTIELAKEKYNQEIIDAYEQGQKDTANGFFIKSGNKYLKDKYK